MIVHDDDDIAPTPAEQRSRHGGGLCEGPGGRPALPGVSSGQH